MVKYTEKRYFNGIHGTQRLIKKNYEYGFKVNL